ncbi:helix-turn-helix domain-containing protein [Nanoarchaeota archaeon]
MIEKLEEIGLTKSEIKVYLALLELGSSTTGPIVEKSGASSSKIYEVLEKLIEKGLVSYIVESGVKHFEAADPKRIMDYMNEKERRLKEQKDEVKKILPELKLKQTLSKYKSEATVYKGIKGVETAYYSALDAMKPGQTVLVMGAPSRSETLNRFFVKYTKELARRKLKIKLIYNEEARGEPQTSKESMPTGEVKYTPEITPSETAVYPDRVIIFPEAKDIILVEIKNKEIVESFRVQFEKWWEQDTTITKGMDALKTALHGLINQLSPNENYDVLGAALGPKGYEQKYSDFFEKFHQARFKKGIPARLLFQQGSKEVIDKYRKSLYQENAKVKFLPYKTESPVAIFPSKEKTLLLVQEKEPTIITINNKEVAKSFQKYFETVWDQDVNVYKGFEAVTDKFTSMLDLYKEGEEYHVLGATYGMGGQKLKDWFMGYSEKRMKKKVAAKFLIAPEDHKQIIYEFTHTGDPEMKYSKVKDLPPDFSTPMQINLYKGNRVLMFLWGKEMMCFEVESEILYNNFKSYFDALWKQDVRVFKGFEGVTKRFNSIILDELEEGDEYYVLGSALPAQESKLESFFMDFHRKRVPKKIKVKLLSIPESYDIVHREFSQTGDPEMKYAKLKRLPPEFKSPFQITLYGKNKVSMIDWTTYMDFEIESETLYNNFKTYFDSLWEQDVTTTKGLDGAKNIFNKMLDELEEGDEYYVMGASWMGQTKEMQGFFRDFHKRRQEKAVKSKFLFVSGAERLVEENSDLYKKLSEVKFLPPGVYEGIQFNLYKNKVLLFVWREKEPVVFTIEDKTTYNTFKSYFDSLWEQNVRAYQGLESIKNLFKETLNFGDYDVFAEGMKIVDVLGEDFFVWWQGEKKKRGIKSKGIMGERYKKAITVTKSITQFRFIPGYEAPGITFIFKDKVVNMILSKKNPTAFLIENKEVADNQRIYFNLLWRQDTMTYKGNDGFKSCYERIFNELKKGDILYVLGAPREANEKFEDFLLNWHEKREEKGINLKILYNHDAKEFGRKRTKMKLAEVKYMKEELETPAWIVIFNDFVVTINVHGEPTCFLIEDKNSAESYKKYFEILWKQAKN